MELNGVIKLRRSIRKFKPDPISDELITELLDAARLAPSGLNLQPWRYVVVKDRTVRESIAKIKSAPHLAVAPVIIVCCYDNTIFETTGRRLKELHEAGAFSDTAPTEFSSGKFLETSNIDPVWIKTILSLNIAISIEHMVLKATDLGLGSCWLGAFDQEEIRKIIQIEDKYDIPAMVAVGYAESWPKARPRLSVDDILLKSI